MIDDITYPKAANIIEILGIKFLDSPDVKFKIVSNPIINKAPASPMIIEINFKKVNLSSLVKKCDKIKVNIGPTESSKPAVFDWMYCSDQLINKNGIKFPINPIIIIKIIFFLERLKEYFVKMKIKNKNNDPMINLKEATEIGLINSTDIFIAKNEDPQIALNKIKSKRLLEKNLFIRKNYLLFFGCGISTVSKDCMKSSL